MECNVARVVDSFPDYVRAGTLTDRGQLRPRFMSPAHDPILAGTLIGASPQWRAVVVVLAAVLSAAVVPEPSLNCQLPTRLAGAVASSVR